MKAWIATALLMFASAAANAGTVTYFHNDFAGSPVVATNANREVIWRESYRPYGERLTNAAAAKDNKVWFTSRRQDADTGLVHMGARYYDPVLGRYISMDPVGFAEGNLHSHNRYAYASNNPLRFLDPSGRWAEDIAFAFPSLIIGATSFRENLSGGRFLAASVDALGIVADGVAAAIPGVPGGAGIVIGSLRKVDAAVGQATADGTLLAKRLASESQMAEDGITIAGKGAKSQFDDAPRVAAQHGGTPDDWVKKSSSSYKAPDGSKIETRWIENLTSGQRVEFKTIVNP